MDSQPPFGIRTLCEGNLLDLLKFFVLVKSAVVDAFYTSEEGINKELSYQGMKFLMNFEGCTHASHSVPESYRPLVGKAKA